MAIKKIKIGNSTAVDVNDARIGSTITGVSTSVTSGSSDATLPTAAAVYNAIDSAVTSVLKYKGTIGSSGATVDALPANHKVGDVYVVSVAGTYAGKAVEVGDYIICKISGTVANDSHWDVVNGENQVDNKNATLSWGNQSTIATVDGTDIKVTMPSKPTYSEISGTPTIPTKVSELDNDSGFTTNTGTVTGVTVGTTAYNPTNGVVTIPAYPITLPASDVSAWAKASTKPSYSYSEISGTPTLGTAAAKNVPSTGNASTTEVVMGNDSRLTDSRPASDVSSWAKAASKPSYALSELSDDSTHRVVTDTEKSTWNAKYDKPSGGIPATDLASAVQTSLGLADTAIQSHQDISGKADKSEMAVSTNGDSTTITLKTGTSTTVINAHQDISGKEDKSNKVTSISSESTDTQYPSAKAVYNAIKIIDSSDLSHFDVFGNHLIAQNTANSYVVHRPGIYKIPLIYGNGIYNSQINARAYTKLASDYTADFVNHLGNVITSPYIEKNSGCTASSAGLLWQTSNCISAVSVAEDLGVKYLMFVVNNIPDTNADAVLYVKDASDNIMWSWTIWMVNNLPSNVDIVNYTGVTYTMMGLPFGAIWNSENTKYMIPLYQWGRKDPMVPATAYNSNSNITVYDINGNVYSGFGALGSGDDSLATKTVANSIQNPNLFFTYYNTTTYNWNNLSWMNNFWNAAETTSSSLADNQATAIKTIYDPSPVGYMLPSGRFATGFTTTGSNISTASEFNVIGSFDNGWTFKKNSSDTSGIFFPAAGCRNVSSSGLYATGSYGHWWSFAPNSQAYARNLFFNSGYVYPLNDYYRAYGYGVWAALELH